MAANDNRANFIHTNRFIAQPMKKILQHIIYWTDQSFSYPKSSSPALKTWNWVVELKNYVFKKELDNGQRPWRLSDEQDDEDFRFVVTSIDEHIQSFMSKLWNHISKEPLWRDPIVLKKQVFTRESKISKIYYS